MKKMFIGLVLALFVVLPGLAPAGNWDFAKNVKRLERVSPDYEPDKDIDKKFLEILDLTEKTARDPDVYAEAKKVAANPSLSQSKYLDSFLYFMLVKSLGLQRTGTAEVDYWLGMLKTQDKSPHLLAAQLIRLPLLPKNSPDSKRDIQAIVEWLKTKNADFKLRAPEYTGNILMGYKPRSNFAEGAPPKLYKLSLYRDAVNPLGGFKEDEAYVALLDRIKEGREDIMTEMAAIYRKAGKRTEAAEVLYQLGMLKAAARDFEKAKVLLDDAVKLNPGHVEAKKQRDRVKLELTYKSLAPAETPAKPAEAPAAPAPESGGPAAATPEMSPAPAGKGVY